MKKLVSKININKKINLIISAHYNTFIQLEFQEEPLTTCSDQCSKLAHLLKAVNNNPACRTASQDTQQNVDVKNVDTRNKKR